MNIINKKNRLRSLIYGGIDGIITIFNLISGIEGAKMKSKVIIILGLGTLIADATSMGFGDYLSIQAESKYQNNSNNTNNPNNKNYEKPIVNGFITFMSFVIFGMIPLASYVLFNKFSNKGSYLKTYISTILSLFLLGSIQSNFTNIPWYESGTYTTLYGMLASIISYYVANLMSSINH